MSPQFFCSGWFLAFLLLFADEPGRAKPVMDVQTLSKWLEDDLELQPVVSEETQDQDEALLTEAVDQQEQGLVPWLKTPRQGSLLPDSSAQRLFNDLLGFSRRYQGRSKKGLSRGCFGVKLDRIGALSGLGC